MTLRIGVKNFNNEDLPHELLLTTRQTTKLRNAINNNMSTDIKLSKAQIKKIIQSGGFLGKLLGPLLKTGLPLLKSVIEPLGLLGLTAASSAIGSSVQKKIAWFWIYFKNNNFNNFKWRNELHNENYSSFRKFRCFIKRSY